MGRGSRREGKGISYKGYKNMGRWWAWAARGASPESARRGAAASGRSCATPSRRRAKGRRLAGVLGLDAKGGAVAWSPEGGAAVRRSTARRRLLSLAAGGGGGARTGCRGGPLR